jgi:hypothetical protein
MFIVKLLTSSKRLSGADVGDPDDGGSVGTRRAGFEAGLGQTAFVSQRCHGPKRNASDQQAGRRPAGGSQIGAAANRLSGPRRRILIARIPCQA